MSARHVMLVLFACIIAGGVFVFARMSLPQPQPVQVVQDGVVQQAAPAYTGAEILVVKEDTPSGTLLAQPELKFEFRPWPDSGMKDGVYVLKEGGSIDEFKGAVVRTGMRVGEPVVRANIIKRGESGFLAAVLQPGMRAVSLNVNNNTGVAGFIFPGDHIDLVLSHAVLLPHGKDDSRTHNISETVLHDIRVVAVDQRSSDQEQVPAVSDVVTLEVTPEQAERVALAQRMGELRTVLRSMVVDGSSAEAGAPVAAEQRTFTLDSDLSQIIAPPGDSENGDQNGNASGSSIQLIRGNTTTDVETK